MSERVSVCGSTVLLTAASPLGSSSGEVRKNHHKKKTGSVSASYS